MPNPNPIVEGLSFGIFGGYPGNPSTDGFLLGTLGMTPTEATQAQDAARKANDLVAGLSTGTELLMIGGAGLLLYFMLKRK
jgi:hypothetical protein